MKTDFTEMKGRIKESIKEHDRELVRDSYVYHISLFIAFAFSGAAAVMPATEDYIWLTKILSAIAAFVIALDRAANWAGRWVYHREMKSEYLILEAKIHFFDNICESLPDTEREKYRNELYSDLYAIRRKEIQIPGVNSVKAPESR
jgi:hypothetical protein